MAKQLKITQEIVKKMERFGLYSQESKGLDAKIIMKVFNPYGRGTWIITEAEKQEDGDWLLFGLINIFEWEWGYVLLSELVNTKINVFGCKLPLEIEKWDSKKTVREVIPQAIINKYDEMLA